MGKQIFDTMILGEVKKMAVAHRLIYLFLGLYLSGSDNVIRNRFSAEQ